MNEDNTGSLSGESPWVVVKHLKSSSNINGYKLVPQDVIKLGRVKLRIRQVCLNEELLNKGQHVNKCDQTDANAEGEMGLKNSRLVTNNENNNENNQNQSINKKRNFICRICYCDDKEIDSPLIQPCSCSGTMKYIHYSCLQQWLNSRIVERQMGNSDCTSFVLKQVECELCKFLLPDYVMSKGKVYEIWDFKPKYKTYITFETVNNDRHGNRTVYVVNLENKPGIKIGRGFDSDIRISDISNQDNSIVIEDNQSKFGSLVLLQHPNIKLIQQYSLPIQVGRTFLNFILKQPVSFFSCCKTYKEIIKGEDYQMQNSEEVIKAKIKLIKVETDNSIKDLSVSVKKVDTSKVEDNETNKYEEGFLKVLEYPSNSNEDVFINDEYKKDIVIKETNIILGTEIALTNVDQDFDNKRLEHKMKEVKRMVREDLNERDMELIEVQSPSRKKSENSLGERDNLNNVERDNYEMIDLDLDFNKVAKESII